MFLLEQQCFRDWADEKNDGRQQWISTICSHFTTNRVMDNGHAQCIQQIQHALHNCRCNLKFIISYTMTWWEMEMPRYYFYRNACWLECNNPKMGTTCACTSLFTPRSRIKMSVCCSRAFVRIVCTNSVTVHILQQVVVIAIHMQWKEIQWMDYCSKLNKHFLWKTTYWRANISTRIKSNCVLKFIEIVKYKLFQTTHIFGKKQHVIRYLQ